MARIITGEETISGWLRETVAALERRDQEESEALLSSLMGDVLRLLRPNPGRGFRASTSGFAGDRFGLDHGKLKNLETALRVAQSFVRSRDLYSAVGPMRQGFHAWTGEEQKPGSQE